jgi:MtN3 and saliva related transmembrane protein
MQLSTLIGCTAGALGVISFIPQVIKSWKTKSLHDLSWGWLALFTTADILWIVYGVLVSSMPVIATNVAIGTLLLVLVYIKMKY